MAGSTICSDARARCRPVFLAAMPIGYLNHFTAAIRSCYFKRWS
jgi:hypothetical protein